MKTQIKYRDFKDRTVEIHEEIVDDVSQSLAVREALQTLKNNGWMKTITLSEDEILDIAERLSGMELEDDKEYEDDFKSCTIDNPIEVINEDKEIIIKIKVV